MLEWPQHFSHYKSMGIFPDAQGQLTPQSEVEPGRNSNSSEMLWFSLLPARMKKIQSEMKLLEWPQHFPHYNSMGAICCHGNQSSDPTWPKTYCNLSPSSMMLQIKFDCDWPCCLRDFKFENVNGRTDRRTHPRTPARLPYCKLTL